MGQFIKVAKVSEISPGNGKQIDAGGRTIALFNLKKIFVIIVVVDYIKVASRNKSFIRRSRGWRKCTGIMGCRLCCCWFRKRLLITKNEKKFCIFSFELIINF